MFELWGVWTDLERVKGNAKQLELICVSLEVGGGGRGRVNGVTL